MRAIIILFAAAAAACGSVHDRSECSASSGCPAGSYCARTGDGDVCWPDAVAPVVSGVSVACDHEPCLRNDVLRVTATITDDAELSGADVSLLGSTAIPLARSGGATWSASLPLARFPFEAFEAEVVATVTARDAARNERSMAAGPVTVTRLAWERTLDPGTALTSPAVMENGTVATAGANHRLYLVAWDGVEMASTAVGTLQITAAPLALGTSVWVGGEDNFVYEVATTAPGSWHATAKTNNTGGPIRGSLASTSDHRVLAASDSGFVYAINAGGYMPSARGPSFSLGPVVDIDGSIYAVGGSAARRLTMDGAAPTFDASFVVTLGSPVGVPLVAMNALLALASNGADGLLKKVVAAGGDPQLVATTGDPSAGVAVAQDGSILVPEKAGTISRWTSTGSAVAGWHMPALDGAARTPLVLADSSVPFVVSTSSGGIRGLDAFGNVCWRGQLGSSPLQPGNIYTPPGQPDDAVTSIAYFAGADGVLHAVIVDGKLDGDAPWPKAFHDPRNTNRAGAQP